MNDPHRYDDMLELPHPTSDRHPRMSALNRAAQFSPFAALTGYEGKIQDAQQFRCNRITLSQEEQAPINEALSNLRKSDQITVTYFCSDPGTNGSGLWAEGNYVRRTGTVLRYEPVLRTLRIGCDGDFFDIALDDIIALHVDAIANSRAARPAGP